MYREAFDMDLESCFGAFDSEYGRVGCSSASYSELRFKNASRPMELKWSWKVPPGTYKLRVLRNSRSLQRRFEIRAAKAVTLGALGRAQSQEKRENICVFQCGTACRSAVLAIKWCLREITRSLLACNYPHITSQKWS